jgi:GNAT superfamily N-acetyltransferase
MEVEFRWCRTPEEATRLARLFSDHLSPAYISHSELQGARARAPGVWSPDIASVIEEDILARVDRPLDASYGSETRLVAAGLVDRIDAGVFLVTFSRAASIPFCILEDMMIVPKQRNRGLGKAFVEWISAQSTARGIGRLFLESGIANDPAHRFFETVGFRKVSVVMMKQL